MENEAIRSYVYNLYPGNAWHHKVNQMPHDQVYAIYVWSHRPKRYKTPEGVTTYSCPTCVAVYERDNPDLKYCELCGSRIVKIED